MRRIWLATGLVCAALGGVLFSASGQLAHWKEARELANAHITYSHAARYDRSCPAYTIDVFGDGRVKYVGIENVATTGAWSYRVSGKALQPWLKDFIISSFWSREQNALTAPGGSACGVAVRYQNVVRSNGCYNHVGEDGLTLESASLAPDIAQMEAILHIDRFTHRDAQIAKHNNSATIQNVTQLQ